MSNLEIHAEELEEVLEKLGRDSVSEIAQQALSEAIKRVRSDLKKDLKEKFNFKSDDYKLMRTRSPSRLSNIDDMEAKLLTKHEKYRLYKFDAVARKSVKNGREVTTYSVEVRKGQRKDVKEGFAARLKDNNKISLFRAVKVGGKYTRQIEHLYSRSIQQAVNNRINSEDLKSKASQMARDLLSKKIQRKLGEST